MTVYESRGMSKPTTPDLCAVCDKPILVRMRVWELVRSTWGLVVCADYCSASCVELAHDSPEEVADRLRSRMVGA